VAAKGLKLLEMTVPGNNQFLQLNNSLIFVSWNVCRGSVTVTAGSDAIFPERGFVYGII
jgi:hypothetical protein